MIIIIIIIIIQKIFWKFHIKLIFQD